MTALTVAISPCPNDSFIFGPWVLGLFPHGLDTRFFWHDVQELNQGALDSAWDVVKVSAATALRLDGYAILNCGGAFGLEHGPKLVTRPGGGPLQTIAVPGLDTTAAALLRAAMPSPYTPKPMTFHLIADAVRHGQVDAGVLIHETALVYDRYGLALHTDLGQWWRTHTGDLPLPLGCIVARRSLGERTHRLLEQTIRQSIRTSQQDTPGVMPFISSLARELDAATLEQHIAAYVNDFSLDMGPRGRTALTQLKTLQDLS